jgi:class 3 adenylate cyclase
LDAERRQVTVLFTDMVGFTTFSERSGEEAAYTLMRGLSKLMDDAVHEHGGVVQSFTGDGIMAVFGAPVAFEDAPLRACRAALHILDRRILGVSWRRSETPAITGRSGHGPADKTGWIGRK